VASKKSIGGGDGGGSGNGGGNQQWEAVAPLPLGDGPLGEAQTMSLDFNNAPGEGSGREDDDDDDDDDGFDGLQGDEYAVRGSVECLRERHLDAGVVVELIGRNGDSTVLLASESICVCFAGVRVLLCACDAP